MEKQKKPWVKPELGFIPAGSPKYNEIMAALEAEKTQTDETQPHGGE